MGATNRTLACPECGSTYVQGVKFCAECGVPLSSAALDGFLELGDLVGNYRLLEVLGEGGMGRVYVAEHVKLGRRVAVKKLHSELASNPTAVARFFSEARAVNRISHENIVEITDFLEQTGGDNYIVMELLKGEDLGQRLRRQRALALPRAFDIAAQTASALSAVHAAGIIHRDLKPDNIFLIDRGGSPDFVKVLDFGVAKLTDAAGVATHVTAAGQIIGTPEYMSPEQAGGMAVDYRTDIYALGVILYEMVTGELPFQAKSFGELLIQHMTSPVELPSFVPGLPQVIQTGRDQLLLQLLAKKPSDRPKSMAEVETRLRTLLDAMELPQRPRRRSSETAAAIERDRGEPLPPKTGAGTGGGGATPIATAVGAVAKLALIKRPTPQAAVEMPTPRSISRIEVPTPTSLARYNPERLGKISTEVHTLTARVGESTRPASESDRETQSAKLRRIARLQVTGSSPGLAPPEVRGTGSQPTTQRRPATVAAMPGRATRGVDDELEIRSEVRPIPAGALPRAARAPELASDAVAAADTGSVPAPSSPPVVSPAAPETPGRGSFEPDTPAAAIAMVPSRRAASPRLEPRRPSEPGARPRRSRGVLWIGALAVVVAGAFVAYELRPDGEAGPAGASPTRAAQPIEPAEIKIKFVSAPPGATVQRLDTGEQLGTTPFTRSFARSDRTARFEFTLPGFAPTDEDLALSADDAIAAALAPIAPLPAPPPPAASAPVPDPPARRPAPPRRPSAQPPVDRNGTLDVFKTK